MSAWIVGYGKDYITHVASYYSEEDADAAVDTLITEDYEFKGDVSPAEEIKVYEWRHPNGDIVRQMEV